MNNIFTAIIFKTGQLVQLCSKYEISPFLVLVWRISSDNHIQTTSSIDDKIQEQF